MKWKSLHVMNFCILAITLWLCLSLQSVFWFQIFGSITGPALWFGLFIYLILERDEKENLFIIYALCLLILPFTAMTLKILLLSFMILYFVLRFFKERVYVPGIRFFVTAHFLSLIFFHFLTYLLSRQLDHVPADLELGPRFLQIFLSTALCPWAFYFLKWLDRWSWPILSMDSGASSE